MSDGQGAPRALWRWSWRAPWREGNKDDNVDQESGLTPVAPVQVGSLVSCV